MDNEDAPSSVNFIPCVKWVKKGVAKQIPEKVQLTEEELQEIISETRTELRRDLLLHTTKYSSKTSRGRRLE